MWITKSPMIISFKSMEVSSVSRTSKCRCGPVDHSVFPTLPHNYSSLLHGTTVWNINIVQLEQMTILSSNSIKYLNIFCISTSFTYLSIQLSSGKYYMRRVETWHAMILNGKSKIFSYPTPSIFEVESFHWLSSVQTNNSKHFAIPFHHGKVPSSFINWINRDPFVFHTKMLRSNGINIFEGLCLRNIVKVIDNTPEILLCLLFLRFWEQVLLYHCNNSTYTHSSKWMFHLIWQGKVFCPMSFHQFHL